MRVCVRGKRKGICLSFQMGRFILLFLFPLPIPNMRVIGGFAPKIAPPEHLPPVRPSSALCGGIYLSLCGQRRRYIQPDDRPEPILIAYRVGRR